MIRAEEITRGPTRRLASFVAEASPDMLPTTVVHQAKRCWLDWIGVALGGCRMPAVDHLLAVAGMLGSSGPLTVLGRDSRLDAWWAALVNGEAGHVLDFDDTLLPPAPLHATAAVLPAVLALSEWRHLDGRRALLAGVVGTDVACRSAIAFGQTHMDRGFHGTGTVGSIGAAAACSVLLGLDADRTAHALGLAASQASGLRAFHGSMTKGFQAGRAAANGILAALLAERGFDSSDDFYESVRGLSKAMTDRLDADALLDGLGHRWLIMRLGFKPYPTGVVTHPIIDAMLALRDGGVRAEDVERIELAVHPEVLDATGKADLETELDAKFSVYHCAAVALIDGELTLAQITQERNADPAVIALRRRVSATVTPGLGPEQARVTVTRRNGSQTTIEIKQATGTERNPLTDSQLVRKFHTLVAPVLGADRAAHLASRMWSLEEVADLGEVAALGVPRNN